MRNKVLIIILLISLKGFGQDAHSFKIENGQLEWQKVFQTELTQAKIEKILRNNGIFKDPMTDGNQINGRIENITADYKGTGKNSWNTSFYVQNTSINGTFYIEFKDGRFRVTFNGINLRTTNDLSGNGITVMSANSVQPLSDFAIKKGKFRKGFLRADVKIFEYTFTNLFNFNKYKSKSGDW